MALINSGGLVGQISGRLGGDVYSHNRYGAYVRKGSIPVTSTTSFALAAKARLGSRSAAWQGLTAAQRIAWQEWANTNPVTNRLGQTITLSGNAAYNGINTRLDLFGQTPLTVPPILAAPAALTALSLVADIGAGAVEATFAATPTGANDAVFYSAAVVDSAGINYIQNLLRFIGGTGGASASPTDIELILTTRFGALTVGQTVHITASVFGLTTGLLSAPLRASAVVVST